MECKQLAAFEVLTEAQDKHLGARPGILLGLHTWGSALPLHPHLHGLVTAGGIRPDGRWQASPPNFLIWGPVLRDVFRGKLIELLRDLHFEQKLRLPPDLDDDALRALLHEARQLEWHVRIEPQYSHGAGLVKYLARYLRGGPIKNHRLISFDGRNVRFSCKQTRHNGRDKWRPVQMSVEDFLDRLFEHVPPKGFHVVRGYGLYSRRERQQRDSCRFQIQPLWLQPSPQLVAKPPLDPCPQCGSPVRTLTLSRLADARDLMPMGPHGPPVLLICPTGR